MEWDSYIVNDKVDDAYAEFKRVTSAGREACAKERNKTSSS